MSVGENETLSRRPSASRHVGSVNGDGSVSALGDIVGRDKIIVGLPDSGSPEREISAITGYLNRIRNETDLAPNLLAEFQLLQHASSPISLRRVYVSRHVSERIAYGQDESGREYRIPIDQLGSCGIAIVGDWEMVPMTEEEFFAAHGRTLLLGDPGLGKTSTARALLARAASAFLEKTITPDRHEHPQSPRPPFPYFLDAEAFSDSEHFGATAENVCAFIKVDLGIFADAYAPFTRALANGSTLVICDGMDEVDPKRQSTLAEALSDISRINRNNRLLVTCPTRDFEANPALHLPGFDVTRLTPFARDDAVRYVRKLREAIAEVDPQSQVDVGDFESQLEKPETAALAEHPLHLAQLALIHIAAGEALPTTETGLYNEAISQMLSHWAPGTSGGRELSFFVHEDVDRADLQVEAIIQEVAFRCYQESGDKPIKQETLLEVLAPHFAHDWGKTQRFCEFLTRRARIMKQSGHRYHFLYPTYHEVFAAKHLVSSSDFISTAVDLVRSDPPRWGSIFSRAVAMSGVDTGMMAVNALCPEPPPPAVLTTAATDTKHWQIILISAEALRTIPSSELLKRPERRRVTENVRSWLTILVETGRLDIDQRVRSAAILEALGDRRMGVLDPTPLMVRIEAGPVLLMPQNIPGRENESPQEHDVDYEYMIARFPVTQAQYAVFVADQPGKVVPHGAPPYDWDLITRSPPVGMSTHPVVLVSWFDAQEYCAWLTTRLRSGGSLRAGYAVRLATYPEWAKAAQGGLQLSDGRTNPMPDRTYPWGYDPRPGCANLKDIQPGCIDATVPVGLFPDGASPYGILDMAGNVMEWIQTAWGSDDPNSPGFPLRYDTNDGRELATAQGLRLLRGGSWLFAEGQLKCACRLDPNMRYPDVGFRIVIAPEITQDDRRKTERKVSDEISLQR